MWPPTKKTELPSFIGICNDYRLFVKYFASIAAPINRKLLKTESDRFTPTQEQLDIFQRTQEYVELPTSIDVTDSR